MLMGMLSITAGQARVLGIDVAADPVEVKQRVGLRARDASHLPLDARRRGARLLQVMFPHVERPDLPRAGRAVRPGLAEKKVKHLSKGMQVKLALLLAVVARAGTAACGRAAVRPGPDRPRGVFGRRAADDLRARPDGAHHAATCSTTCGDWPTRWGFSTRGGCCCRAIWMRCWLRPSAISATLRDGCRPTETPDGHHLAADRGAGVDDHGPRFRAGKGRASPGHRGRRARQRDRPGAGGTIQGLHSRTKGSP